MLKSAHCTAALTSRLDIAITKLQENTCLPPHCATQSDSCWSQDSLLLEPVEVLGVVVGDAKSFINY